MRTASGPLKTAKSHIPEEGGIGFKRGGICHPYGAGDFNAGIYYGYAAPPELGGGGGMG